MDGGDLGKLRARSSRRWRRPTILHGRSAYGRHEAICRVRYAWLSWQVCGGDAKGFDSNMEQATTTPPSHKSPLPCNFPVSQHVSKPKMSQITAATLGDPRLRCSLGISPMLLRAISTSPPPAPLLHQPSTSHSPQPTAHIPQPTAHSPHTSAHSIQRAGRAARILQPLVLCGQTRQGSPRFRPGNLTWWHHRAGLQRFSGNMSGRSHSPTLWTLR